jgi:hypothetical protein
LQETGIEVCDNHGMNEETAALLKSLDNQRGHVLGILEGLSNDSLSRAVLPSGWTCLGMVRHLALDVEQFWFRRVMAGESIEDEDEGNDPPWTAPAGVAAETVFERYRQEIERANRVITSTDLLAPPRNWPDEMWPDWRFPDLRAIVLHVITETACHAGHLDAARELIDGRLWMSE